MTDTDLVLAIALCGVVALLAAAVIATAIRLMR